MKKKLPEPTDNRIGDFKLYESVRVKSINKEGVIVHIYSAIDCMVELDDSEMDLIDVEVYDLEKIKKM